MILLLNGPPNSGKNYVGNYLEEKFGYTQLSFARPIKEATMRFYNLIGSGILTDYISFFETNNLKDVPQDLLDGLTPRQAYIWIGEAAKVAHGKDYWTDKLIEDIFCIEDSFAQDVEKELNFVVTDLGFDYEAERFAEAFRLDALKIIQIVAPNTSFKGDSRNWVEPEGIPVYTVYNDKTANFNKQLDELIYSFTEY